MPAAEVYEFGAFVLDVAERRLSRDGRAIAVAPKAHDVLVALVRRAGHLVSKRDLLDLVWPDAHVEEGILSVHISSLRAALDDRGRAGKYIETVSRAGYRFSAPTSRRSTRAEVLPTRWPVGVLPASPAVHELIGRGRAHLLTNSRAEIPKAVEAFEAAVELDPFYAAAHAGLALAHCAEAELRLAPPHEAYSAARAAALRALAMDNACADAQVALGAVLFLSDWNWTGARRSLERAIELDPDHTDAYLLYGRLLEVTGDIDGGLAAKQKALERNPTSGLVQLQIALSYWRKRQYDRVIEWAERALATDPSHLMAREYLAGAYLMKGDLARHAAEGFEHAAAAGVPSQLLDELRALFAREGRRGMLRYALAKASAGGPPFHLALLHGELGEADAAFAALDRAIDARDPCLVDIGVSPQWDCLRGDARFGACLSRIGLPPSDCQTAAGRVSEPHAD